jgi:hypothetical protein
MRFYIYRRERYRRKNDQGALALMILEKELRLIKPLILEISNERLWSNGSKCNKHKQ